jgi:mono/diheme cytochrome c family protein
MQLRIILCSMAALWVLSACSASPGAGAGAQALAVPWTSYQLPAPTPDQGDPVAGEYQLLNGNYMSCGLPFQLWNYPVASQILQPMLGQGRPPMPGRSGDNANVPYNLNVFQTVDGSKVVNLNCLTCHGGYFDGNLVVGLGDSTPDFTTGLFGNLPVDLIQSWMLLPFLGFSDADRSNANILLHTARALQGQLNERTVGSNPAIGLAVILAQHRDPATLAWSDAPLFPVNYTNSSGQPIADHNFTADPAPWWRVHKTNGLFSTGMTRGYHRGTMEMASSICVHSVAEAQRVDGIFQDIQAYVDSIRAPTYTRSIDPVLASQGRDLFNRDCSGCHGTYAVDRSTQDTQDTYPNRLIPLSVVGTDPEYANLFTEYAAPEVNAFNASFYGSVTPLQPGVPFKGYVPPPMDGIWATGPFMHNGSVPNVYLMLNSAARPTYWKRVDYDSTNFDEQNLGWPYIAVPYGQDAAPSDEAKYIYDTTKWSQSNAGHTFGDAYTDADRYAVIEYLKTL